ncbi:hypothetical protein BN2476_320120 [Paraburkholderia piptadeniae]|uniref:Transposase n=2 Tax=Paraburkholderia piptadeniae TaxID=1701573 RepID=A0A1N7S551_9BURK|nr:hypothetical protein BN2476_320120 [Paraburkholderia piptadeniae]
MWRHSIKSCAKTKRLLRALADGLVDGPERRDDRTAPVSRCELLSKYRFAEHEWKNSAKPELRSVACECNDMQ